MNNGFKVILIGLNVDRQMISWNTIVIDKQSINLYTMNT